MLQTVTFTWTITPDPSITKYNLFEILTDGTRVPLGTQINPAVKSGTVGLDDTVAHNVHVASVNAVGESDPSPVDVVPAAPPPPARPAAPLTLTHT